MILTDKNTFCNRCIRRKIEKYKYNKACLINTDNPITGVKLRKWLHPLLMRILQVKSVLCGLTYEMIDNVNGAINDKAVIYAITHIGKYDYEMVVEALDIWAYPFAGDWEIMYATIDDYFLRLNGVIYVDTNDKEDRKNSFEYMTKAIKQGISILIFPEGIWNVTQNLPVMKNYPGTVRAAKECHVPVIPIAVEQRGKHFIINVGAEMYFENMEEAKAIDKLRDTLASLKWEIWQHLPVEKRAEIEKGYYDRFVTERISECAGFSMELINSRVYRDKRDREYQAVKDDLEKLKIFGTGAKI